MTRRGLVIETTLAFVAILSLLGGVAGYVISRETKTAKSTKDSIKALKAAQSGVEEALVKLKNGVGTFPYAFNGTIDGSYFYVNLTKNSDNSITIISTGKTSNALRKVEVKVEKTGIFYPFAINGLFKINDFDNTGSGNWTEAEAGVKTIDNNTYEELTDIGFKITISNTLDVPKVADIDSSIFYPSESECDYGNYNTDLVVKNDPEDVNNDGKIVVCGKNITLDDALIYFNKDTVIAAKGNVTFTPNTTLKQKVGSASDLSIIAGDTAYFDRNSNIDFSGADEGFNLILYAKNEISSPDTTGQFISISGNQNTANVSNVFIMTEGEINVNRDIIDDTATTRNDVNFVLWGDKGINSENGGFDIAGSSSTVRNFSVIVANGDAVFDHWAFSGSEDRSGLSYKDIVNYCLNGTSLGIPETVKQLYCELKTQIETGSGEIKIIYWKEY
ncbi:pilus assembly PilX N-terminal domain-containing protein [Desulfurobacterium atlanticum]|uniref:Uncharacterized protein n=1 Tax=Desulfurobacterium atlanticum TaxID=240169 RepID=A0A238XLF6_9BACT|nr:pilus assembly PilX N-terminal domain-containing protein [Desulfurobacterium atlanticum]SNR59303.1 hypothetical protein SAMN06265340_10158 [Desulfurobacterium atlanticum]